MALGWLAALRIVCPPLVARASLVWPLLVAAFRPGQHTLLLGVNDPGAIVCRLAQLICWRSKTVFWARELTRFNCTSSSGLLFLRWVYRNANVLDVAEERAELRARKSCDCEDVQLCCSMLRHCHDTHRL